MFVKLFESAQYGQLLVVKDTTDEGEPQVTYSWEPPGYGVCHSRIIEPDTDEGHAKIDALFAETTIEDAEVKAQEIWAMLESAEQAGDIPLYE